MRFERVEYESFSKDMRKWLPVMKDARDSYLAKILNVVTMPRRETKGSAGYDFRLPIPVTIPSGGKVVVPSGIRAVFREDEMDTWHLQVYVRSSTGIREETDIPNGTGIIDADYYLSENGGDILLALKNNSDHTVMFGQGERVCQGIFMIHGLTEDDDANGYRTGGVGSTGR